MVVFHGEFKDQPRDYRYFECDVKQKHVPESKSAIKLGCLNNVVSLPYTAIYIDLYACLTMRNSIQHFWDFAALHVMYH